VEQDRKAWNEKQSALREMLESERVPEEAFGLFFEQHAALHHPAVGGKGAWSFADEVVGSLTEDSLTEAQWRRIPRCGEHSVAWVIWHIARIEDVTLNMLAAGQPQLADEGWFERLGTPLRHTGNAMDVPAVQQLSDEIDLEALCAYRQAVGGRTRQIVQGLKPADLKRHVEEARLQRVLECGAVLEEARSVCEYWGRRDIAGLLLMPPTRHCFLHLNEAQRILKKK
jgi:hypothetical protein